MVGLCKLMDKLAPALSKQVHISSNNPRDVEVLNKVIQNVQPYMRYLAELNSKTQQVLPFVTDNPSKNRINKINEDLTNSLRKLEFSIGMVETPTSKAIQNIVQELEKQDAKFSSNILFSQIGILVQTVPRSQSIKMLKESLKSKKKKKNSFCNIFNHLFFYLQKWIL